MPNTFHTVGNAENIGALTTTAILSSTPGSSTTVTLSPTDALKFFNCTGGSGTLIVTLSSINETEYSTNSSVEDFELPQSGINTTTGVCSFSSRAFNGTTAQAWASGSKIEMRMTAYHLSELQAAVLGVIPSVTGNAGKALFTDGTNIGWLPVAGDSYTGGNGINITGSVISAVVSDSTLTLGVGGLKLTSLPSGQVLIGNVSNIATAQNISGDATITNAGVLTVAAGAITPAKLANVSGLTPGSYAFPSNVTVNPQGQITSIAAGGGQPNFAIAKILSFQMLTKVAFTGRY